MVPYKNPSDPVNVERARKSRRDWYERNKEKQATYKQQRDLEIKQWFEDLKSQLCCERCSESHPATLDFHHRDPSMKESAVTIAVHTNGWSKKRILQEIDKCEVLCSNCHRKHHCDEPGS